MPQLRLTDVTNTFSTDNPIQKIHQLLENTEEEVDEEEVNNLISKIVDLITNTETMKLITKSAEDLNYSKDDIKKYLNWILQIC